MVSLFSSKGGNASSTGEGGDSGSILVKSGEGGDGGTNQNAGSSGTVTIESSAGGAASGTGDGGNGGNISITAGNGGDGGNTSGSGDGGHGGSIRITAGTAGTGNTNGTDGDIHLETRVTKGTNIVGGFLTLPRVTTTQRDLLTADEGMTIYNTITGKFQGYANPAGGGGAGWVDLH